jgi:hypothetical protein
MENKEMTDQGLDLKVLHDKNEYSALVRFLEKTKDGEYSLIAKGTVQSSRFVLDSETVDLEEDYYQSLS